MDLKNRIARVAIAHNQASREDDPSTADVLAQAETVTAALAELGIPSDRLPVPGDRILQTFAGHIDQKGGAPGTLVFNLMEAPPGSPHFYLHTTAALELTGLPFTGSAAAVMWTTTDKIATRGILADAGLPVAPGGRLDPERAGDPGVLDRVPPPWIVKPAWEDASIGLEGDPVCTTREAALARAADLARRFPGQPVLAERFLPGREINVSLLAGAEGPEVLPVAEIVYEDFPEGMSRVLGYEAKWHDESFASLHTVRRFPSGGADAPLLEKVRRLAVEAWRVCGLAGYARIDLRLDEAGEPHILEVNANPCLAADAGFMAAAAEAGLAPRDVVRRILEAALRDHGERTPAAPAPVAIRRGLEPADRPQLEEMIRATGFFNADEVEVALELVDERLRDGEASHYRFLVGEVDGRVAGYACWGSIPGTRSSADLYWIVVHPREQGRGAGRALLAAAEEWIADAGRDRVYVETSTRAQYEPTRAFYLACGYDLVAELPDFYAPGDGKAMFLKVLEGDDPTDRSDRSDRSDQAAALRPAPRIP